MSLTKKIAFNTAAQFSGKIVSIIIGVIAISVMARYLGAAGFGQYSTVVAYLQLFGILADLGLSLTVIRLISDPKENTQKVLNNIFTIRFISAFIFLGIAPLAIIFFPYEAIIKIGVVVATLSFFFASLNQILMGLFQKELRTDKVAIAEVLGRLALLSMVVWAAAADLGLLYVLGAMVAGSATTFVVNYLFSLKYVKIVFAFDRAMWKKVFKITWPISISIAFNLIYFKADTLILSLTRSQVEVGIYNAPYRVLEILTTFPFLFMGIMLPILTAYWAEKRLDDFRRLYQKSFDFLVIAAIPLIFGAYFLADELMVLIAGPEFLDSGFVLRLIIIATAIIFINTLFSYNILVIDKQRQMIWGYIGVAIFAFTLYLIYIPQYGYLAAAIITIISEASILFLNALISTLTIKFFPSLLIVLKVVFASLVMSLALYLLAGMNVILLTLVATIVYFLALLLFRGISMGTIKEIVSLRK